MTDTKTTDMNVENLLELNLLFAPGIFLIPEKNASGQVIAMETHIGPEVTNHEDAKPVLPQSPAKEKQVIRSNAIFFLDITRFKEERKENPEELIKKITSILTIEKRPVQPSDYEILDLNIFNIKDVSFDHNVKKIVIFTNEWLWSDSEVNKGEKGLFYNRSAVRFSDLPEILADSVKKVEFANKLRSYFAE